MVMRAMGLPARGYSWPPFQPGYDPRRRPAPKGHELRATHGGLSQSTVTEEFAAKLVSELLEVADWLMLTDLPAARAWARAEVRIARVVSWLDEHGELDANDQVRPAVGVLDRLERQAESLRSKLGLDPSSRLALMARAVEMARPSAAEALATITATGAELVDGTGPG